MYTKNRLAGGRVLVRPTETKGVGTNRKHP